MVSLSITTSGLSDGTQIDAADVLTPVNELKVHLENTLNGVQAFDQQKFTAASELTIDASGAITITQSYHRVDTEADAATDNLDTISGGVEGDILYLRAENSGRIATIRHLGGGTGNIRTWNGASIETGLYKVIQLINDGTYWVVLPIFLSIAILTEKTTPVAADLLLIEDSAASNQQKKIQIGNLPGVKIAVLRDEKSTGTNGGASSATTWNNRNLNTEVSDTGSIVSIASNQLTPVSGTFVMIANALAREAGQHRLRLFNVTGAASVDEGLNAQNTAAASMATMATLFTVFTANGTDAYRIDHYTTSAKATNGLGTAVGDGTNEVYLEILLIKVA